MPTKIEVLAGGAEITVRPRPWMDKEECAFLKALSHSILQDQEVRQYVDLMAFGFWIRNSQIKAWQEEYKEKNRLGRGLLFHIAPSNVAMNFAYSWVFGLLSGNSNRVRISSKPYPQVDIFCSKVETILKDFPKIREENQLLRYDHDETINRAFSLSCHGRIVWGGDKTVETMRKFTLKPKAIELNFPNKRSLAMVDGEDYLALSEAEKSNLARLFYNDTYFSDQQACSSPAVVCFHGQEKEKAEEVFWIFLAKESKKYPMDGVRMVGKYTLAMEYFAQMGGRLLREKDHLMVIRPEKRTLLDHAPGGFGLFYSYLLEDLEEMMEMVSENTQSLLYFGRGKKAVASLLQEKHVTGLDRIVPIGEGLSMEMIWDGVDVLRYLSRIVRVI